MSSSVGETFDRTVAFLFDSGMEHEWVEYSLGGGAVKTKINIINDTVGCHQSGHYLWPAALSLSDYLLSQWPSLQAEGVTGRIHEVGSGSGLLGLSLAQMEGVQSIMFSDHDNGTLELIQEAVRLQGERMRCADIATCYIEWGDCASFVGRQHSYSMVVGSDVIYDVTVVAPLFLTIDYYLAKGEGEGEGEGACCFLGQSFRYSDIVEEEIDDMCCKYKLRREVLVDTLYSSGDCTHGSGLRGESKCRIQRFRRIRE